MGNQDILGWPGETVAFQAAPRFDGDAVVAGRDVAIFDADMRAGIHVNAVAVAADAADDQIPCTSFSQ